MIGTAITNGAGDADVVGTIPGDTPAGRHTVTLDSVDPDGNLVAAQAWFTLDDNGTVTAVSYTGPTPVPGSAVPGTPRFTG